MKNSIAPEHAMDYILGGKAEVGVHSLRTGDTFWYYVRKSSKNPLNRSVYMDWSTEEDDKYIGKIDKDKFFLIVPGTVSPLKQAYITAFGIALKNLTHPQLVILHRGRCSYCGRLLKDAESLIRGLGPICRKRLGL